MKKTNLQKLIDSLEKAMEENMVVYKDSGINEEGTPIRYIIVHNENAYIVEANEHNDIVSCNCPNSYWKGRYKNSPIICKHQLKVASEYNLNIVQLGGLKYDEEDITKDNIIPVDNEDCPKE